MSKNTGTSELINYFDLGVNGDVGIAGSLDINTIANATTDTDTFLVSDTGIIKYRTGAQLLSDIGAAPAVAGGYVPYTGATTNVDLGVYNLTASAIIANGSGSNSGIVHLESNAIHSLVNGYGSIASGTTNQFNLYQTTGAGVFRGAIFSLNSITEFATRTYTLPDTDGTIALTSNIPANAVGGTGTSGTIPVFTGSTTIGNSIIQSNATQVNVVGNGSQLLFDSLGSTKNGGIQYINDFTLQISNSRGTGSSINLGDINLDFNTNVSANPKLRITAGGNVLIGTTTDNGAKLEVAGGGVLSLLLSGNITDATRKFAFIEGKHYTNSEEPIAMIGIDSQVSSSILYIGGGLTSGLNAATSISFQTAANNTTVTGTERMCITSVGQVGIGTSNPVRQFVISNGGADGIEFTQLVGSQTTEIITYNRSTSLYTPLQFESSVYTFNRGNLLIGTTTDNGARLQVSGEGKFYQPLTNTTSYLTVENNRARNAAIRLKTTVGDFLIGTGIGADVNQFQIYDNTAGANRLVISSTGAATFSSSVRAGTHFSLSGRTTSFGYQFPDWQIYNTTGGGLAFNNYSTDAMTITSSGNVGIGTDSPIYVLDAYSTGSSTARLRVQGTTNFALTQAQNSSGILYMGIDSSTANGFGLGNYSRIIWSSAAYPLIFAVNDAERMRITSSGNVGIGSTSPFARLQVTDSNTNEGTIAIGNNIYPGLIFSSAGTGEFRIDNRSSAGGGYISFYPNGQASTLGNEAMRVSTSRNLLIGTTTDTGARLNVGGSYDGYPVSIEAGSGGNQLSLTRGGAVAQFYMGGSTAGGTQFYVRAGGSGGVLLSAGSTGWVSASDIRLKDVTKPIENAVESLSSLQTIYYSWKDSINKNLHIGLIAQEVEKVFPELVSESSIDGMKGVNYTELIPVIIKAIQELNEKINR